MSTDRILFLGALAGLTIFLGLPIGRLRRPALRLKAFLSAAATGILLFLLWDVLSAASEPVEAALTEARAEGGSWPYFIGLAALFAGCLAVGLLSLVYWDRWLAQRRAAAMLGPGSASAAEFVRAPALTPGRRLALFIALGIGLHNFAEGLAIGQSAAGGEISLDSSSSSASACTTRRRASASSRPSPARVRCRAGASSRCSASSAAGPPFSAQRWVACGSTTRSRSPS